MEEYHDNPHLSELDELLKKQAHDGEVREFLAL
jgi:hypothetical protein